MNRNEQLAMEVNLLNPAPAAYTIVASGVLPSRVWTLARGVFKSFMSTETKNEHAARKALLRGVHVFK